MSLVFLENETHVQMEICKELYFPNKFSCFYEM